MKQCWANKPEEKVVNMEIAEIWRYPVKSMLGERLSEANVSPGGLEGDRHWAVVDADSGVSLSAKRYADLLRCQAWTSDDGVMIRMPDDTEFPAGSDDVARELSVLLGRAVTTRSADKADSIKHEFPTALTEGGGDPFLYETNTNGFVDCAPLQLLTTGTLDALSRLLPESNIHPARFRPNFLVKTAKPGFIENDWVNSSLNLGELQCTVYDDTRRCIMVALGQSNLPKDMKVIRAVLKNNEGRAGIALRAQASGQVRCGEKVEISG